MDTPQTTRCGVKLKMNHMFLKSGCSPRQPMKQPIPTTGKKERNSVTLPVHQQLWLDTNQHLSLSATNPQHRASVQPVKNKSTWKPRVGNSARWEIHAWWDKVAEGCEPNRWEARRNHFPRNPLKPTWLTLNEASPDDNSVMKLLTNISCAISKKALGINDRKVSNSQRLFQPEKLTRSCARFFGSTGANKRKKSN